MSAVVLSRVPPRRRPMVAWLMRSAGSPRAFSSGCAGVQLLTGLAAVVLGILAVAGRDPRALSLAALLVLGITVLLTGSALSTLVVSFVRRPTSSQSMGAR